MHATYIPKKSHILLLAGISYPTQSNAKWKDSIFPAVEEYQRNQLTHASFSSSINGLKKLFVGDSLAMSGIIPTRMTFSRLNRKCLGKLSITK